jgi:phage-related minor tail protein
MAEACDNLGNLQVLKRDATGNERTAAYNQAIGWYRKGIDVLTQIERLAPASTDQRKQRDALLRKIETLQQELAQEPEKPHPQGDESRSGG